MKQLACKYARRSFTATRDSAGVPHISAASWAEALYGLGYLHALDRPTQMLFSRAIASGKATEQIADKPELLETDRFFRRIGLHVNLDREVRELDDATFRQITVYCEGVNDGLKESGRSLPMWATGFVPSAWNQEAVLLIGQLLSYAGLVIGQQQNERILLELIHAGVAADKLRELFHPLLDDADFHLLRQVRIAPQLSDEALDLITDLPRLAGSNAWAISPKRSATGSALLASDPHLEINRLPAIWYEAVLNWEGRYAMGATLPGCPLFAVARTENIAWGVTYLKGDTSDYFIEDCRPGGATGWQYRRGTAWQDFDVRREQIVRKHHPIETIPVYHNSVGTMESPFESDEPGMYLSTAWIGRSAGAGRSIGTWLEVLTAPNAAAAMEIARECPLPSLCWVFADRDGHIGLQANGWFPDRGGGHSGLLPIPAWDERNHWRGRLPSNVLPSIYDPPEGFVATANESIDAARGPRLVTLPVPDYRKRRISERLQSMSQATVEDMQQLQYDVISTQARDLLAIFLPHLADGPIKQRLSTWDYNYASDSEEATLFARLYRNVLLELFGHDHGIGWRRMLYLCSRAGFSMMVVTALDRLLHKEESLWWQGLDKGALIRRAAEKLTSEKDQPWGETNSFHFANRYFDHRVLGRALGFASKKIPMPGCHATPFQGHLLKAATRETTFAPSYHFVTDLARDDAWTNLPGGPSESRLSRFYSSDIPLWTSGQYKLVQASVSPANVEPSATGS